MGLSISRKVAADEQLSNSDLLNQICSLSRIGAPFDDLGYAPTEPAAGPRNAAKAPTELRLASGLLDDHRRSLSRDAEAYALSITRGDGKTRGMTQNTPAFGAGR